MIKVGLICFVLILRTNCDISELINNGWKDDNTWNKYNQLSFPKSSWQPVGTPPIYNPVYNNIYPDATDQSGYNYNKPENQLNYTTASTTTEVVSTPSSTTKESVSTTTESPPSSTSTTTEHAGYWYQESQQPLFPQKFRDGSQQFKPQPQIRQIPQQLPSQQTTQLLSLIAQWLYQFADLLQQSNQLPQPTQIPKLYEPELNIQQQNHPPWQQQFESWLQSGTWPQQSNYRPQQSTFRQQFENNVPQSEKQQLDTLLLQLEQWLKQQENISQQFDPSLQFISGTQPCSHNTNQQSIAQQTLNSIQEKPVVTNKDNKEENITTPSTVKETTSLASNNNQINKDKNSTDESIPTTPEPLEVSNNLSKEQNKSSTSYKEFVSSSFDTLPLAKLRLTHYSRILKDIKPEYLNKIIEKTQSSTSSLGITNNENSKDLSFNKLVPQISTSISGDQVQQDTSTVPIKPSTVQYPPTNQYLPPFNNNPQIPQNIDYHKSIKHNNGDYFPRKNNDWKTTYEGFNSPYPSNHKWYSDVFEENRELNRLTHDEKSFWKSLSSENNKEWPTIHNRK